MGGEQSGRIIFHNDDGWFGGGVFTALQVARVSIQEDKPLSRLAAAMERFPQILKNVTVFEKPPISEITAVQDAIREAQLKLGDEGRILVRYSGTEMLARVMVEGRDQDMINIITNDIAAVLVKEIG